MIDAFDAHAARRNGKRQTSSRHFPFAAETGNINRRRRRREVQQVRPP